MAGRGGEEKLVRRTAGEGTDDIASVSESENDEQSKMVSRQQL